jgi:hypothetical protein
MLWLEQALANETDPAKPKPDPVLLITGLRAGDNPRWEIGVLEARVVFDHSDNTPGIELQMRKPPRRRSASEADETRRLFDPEAALALQAHVFFGNQIGMADSESHGSVTYHYPSVHLPGEHFIRFLRCILDAPPNRLARSEAKTFRDLRRRNQRAPWLTQAKASAVYGPQRSGRYRQRSDVVEASLRAWDRNNKISGLRLTRSQFQTMLWQCYKLLDRHLLQG